MLIMESNPNDIIQKTILTARLIDGFWDRWIAHGVDRKVASNVKYAVKDVNDWIKYFSQIATEHEKLGREFKKNKSFETAESHYQLSGLYYNLVHWVFPDRFEEKSNWYKKSIHMFSMADEISAINCTKESFVIDGRSCVGRIRIPKKPKGSIIIINPIDSTKEELFTYEKHFLELDFATFSFDGPGQGETFTLNGLKATTSRWDLFLNELITLTYQTLPNCPIFLFGTSSGASWSIKASQHPYVSKAVAVSPPVSSNDITLPSYFTDRLKSILDNGSNILPKLDEFVTSKPIFLFHGNCDVMVRDQDIYKLFSKLPVGKKIMEYEKETHCCNGKLEEIRKLSSYWFTDN